MVNQEQVKNLAAKFIQENDHGKSDYFGLIKELVKRRKMSESKRAESDAWQQEIDRIYGLIMDEIVTSRSKPLTPVKFGTSGWRGIIGKDLFVKSVQQVTMAIIRIFHETEKNSDLAEALGVASFSEVQQRGGVVGFDNRFGGEVLARSVLDVLAGNGIKVYYAGESTTGVISAALLELGAAFSINLTPSHNPLEYGGYKFNGADGGPAPTIVTNIITERTLEIIAKDEHFSHSASRGRDRVEKIDSLDFWKRLVRGNRKFHGLDYDDIVTRFRGTEDVVLAVDCVHGASRLHIEKLVTDGDPEFQTDRLVILRGEPDPTFGGVAPEPSSANMKPVMAELAARPEPLRIGAVIDPDGDRIRLTDGTTQIDMNLFGAMAYHFLHEKKHIPGMVAKTVATSNFANKLAEDFGEEIFESKVGFKEFKPVIGKALVLFEESDGISVIGHTPEKDAYIGLLLALDMVLTCRKNLGEYLQEIQQEHGFYYPARDGIRVSSRGPELQKKLALLDKYTVGTALRVGDATRTIRRIIDIDGRKMVLDDDSWLMIRPSGTEPKVRFYVEARNRNEQAALFETARNMLSEIGVLKED